MTADLTDITAPQPRKVTVTRYRCPFCRRQNSAKKKIVEHIARCWHNPAVKSCRTCLHFEKSCTETEVYGGEVRVCYQQDDLCTLGQTLPDNGFPAVNCPLWRDRDLEEDDPAEDEWDRDARALTTDGGAR